MVGSAGRIFRGEFETTRFGAGILVYLFFIWSGELMAGLRVSFNGREFDTNVAGIHLRARSSLESRISRFEFASSEVKKNSGNWILFFEIVRKLKQAKIVRRSVRSL